MPSVSFGCSWFHKWARQLPHQDVHLRPESTAATASLSYPAYPENLFQGQSVHCIARSSSRYRNSISKTGSNRFQIRVFGKHANQHNEDNSNHKTSNNDAIATFIIYHLMLAPSHLGL